MSSNNSAFRRRRPPFFPVMVIGIFVMSGVVMWLWNTILPDLVHVSNITYWKAMGLLVLCRILFGGFKFGPPRNNAPFGGPGGWREKWMNMSEEEKAKFKEQWRERCGRKG
ncbi:MAG: hypothetical protein QM768_08405 [Agriterribacter sp.]